MTAAEVRAPAGLEAPLRTLVQLSDPHLRRPDSPLVDGRVDPVARLRRALDVLTTWNVRADAWVLSGDLSDDESPESYRTVRALVTDAAGAVGARVVWANGNHDDRAMFRREVLDAAGDGEVNTSHDIDGLRVLVLDTNVPGVPWGEVSAASLAWLADRLDERARLGTVLVMHHAPIPQPQTAANLRWPLRNPDALAELVAGSDVRVVLTGHVHQPSFGTLAGVPVATAPSLACAQDLTAGRDQRGQDAHQGFALIDVHTDSVVVAPVFLDVAAGVHPPVTDAEARARH